MRVLLAGASGAIGRHLIPLLHEAGHDVIGLTRTPESLAGSGVTEIVADALDRDALLAALDGVKADAVIHQLTALAKPPLGHKEMRVTNRLRTEGTSALIAAARQVGATKLVAASFFGGYGYADLGSTPLAETARFGEPDQKNDAVLRALVSLEQQVRSFGGVALRYGLFYEGGATSVSPVSARAKGLVPNVHLKDAARAAVLALENYRPGEVYNIADDYPMTYRDRESARATAAGIRAPQKLPDAIIRVTALFGAMLLTQLSMVLDSSKAHTGLGWTPEFPSVFEGVGIAVPVVPVVVTRQVTAPVAVVDATPESAFEDLVVERDAIIESTVAREIEPDVEPDAEPEPTEPDTDHEVEPEPELESRVKSTAKSEPAGDSEPSPETSAEPESESIETSAFDEIVRLPDDIVWPKSGTFIALEATAEAATEPIADPEAEPGADADAEADAEAQPRPEPATDAPPAVEPVVKHPKSPAKPRTRATTKSPVTPADPFADMDAAIARIGSDHTD